MTEREPSEPPVLALNIKEAAESIGVPYDTFRRHVLPYLRSVKVGRHDVVTVRELERWLDLNARFSEES